MNKYPEVVYQIGNEFEGIVYCEHLSILENDNRELIGITAETLAELARENGDTIVIRFGNPVYVKSELRITQQAKDEPLNQFFLRVAKERNYIK